jgi:hypothetical protein
VLAVLEELVLAEGGRLQTQRGIAWAHPAGSTLKSTLIDCLIASSSKCSSTSAVHQQYGTTFTCRLR